MNTRVHQVAFLEKIKAGISAHLSSVAEMADLLGISVDSMYRRLRGESDLSLEEAMLLGRHFGKDLPQVGVSRQSVTFQYLSINSLPSLVLYLESLREELSQIHKNSGKIYYQAKDLPFFYHLPQGHFSDFQTLTWIKYVLNQDAATFAPDTYGEVLGQIQKIASQIFDLYQKIDRVEIWTAHTLDSIAQQLKYYHDLGLLSDHRLVLIAKELLSLLETLQKLTMASDERPQGGFALYHSELNLDHNSLFVSDGKSCHVHIAHHSMNKISTNDEGFCREHQVHLQNTLSRANLLNTASEKQRNLFFKALRSPIEGLIGTIH